MLLSFLGSSCRFFLTFLFFFQFKDLVGPIQIFLRINANAFEIRRENLDLGSRFQGTQLFQTFNLFKRRGKQCRKLQ